MFIKPKQARQLIREQWVNIQFHHHSFLSHLFKWTEKTYFPGFLSLLLWFCMSLKKHIYVYLFLFHQTVQSTKKYIPPIPFLTQGNNVNHKKMEALMLMWFGVFSPLLKSSILFTCSLNSINKSSNNICSEKSYCTNSVQQKYVLTRNLHFLSLTTLFRAASSVSALWHMLLLRKDEEMLSKNWSSWERFLFFFFTLYCSSKHHNL